MSPQIVLLSDYDVWEHLPKLRASGLGLAQYAKEHGLGRRALAESIKEVAPDEYDKLVIDGIIGLQADRGKTGTKLETSAREMLERRGYVVMRAHGSHGAIDLLACRADTPTLFVQAKKDGKLGPTEWNELVALAVKGGAWPVLVRRPEGETKGALWFRLISERPKGSRLADYLEPFDPRTPEQETILAPPLAAAS
jgi:Holliday junction resolvase